MHRAPLIAGVVAGLLVRAVAYPRVDVPTTSDAIIALDGDRPRRVRTAVALAASGIAPVLVIVRAEKAAPELLAQPDLLPFELVSFVPEPATTRGEARGIAALAAERGWRQLTVVTSTYHITRARLILQRALNCNVSYVSAGMRHARLPRYILSEAAKLTLAMTIRRGP